MLCKKKYPESLYLVFLYYHNNEKFSLRFKKSKNKFFEPYNHKVMGETYQYDL